MEDLFADILTQAIVAGEIQISCSGMDCSVAEVVEEIICALEGLGSNGGNRHDFG